MADKIKPSELEILTGDPEDSSILLITWSGKTYQIAITELFTRLVNNSLFNANTILAANADNTPAAVAVAEQRLVGRITGGNITALTAAEVTTLLGMVSGFSLFLSGSQIVGDAQTMTNIITARTISKVIAVVTNAPTGSNLTLNLQKNGANDILSSDLTITDGNTTATSTSLDATYKVLAENDYVTLDVNSVGSTTPGTNLMVGVIF